MAEYYATTNLLPDGQRGRTFRKSWPRGRKHSPSEGYTHRPWMRVSSESLVPDTRKLLNSSSDVRKVKPLLDCLEHREDEVWYFALDLAREELERGIGRLTPRYQYIKCFGLWGTFDDGLAWLNSQSFENPRFFMSLGSIFGNDHLNDAVKRLSTWRTQGLQGIGDSMLLTMDATDDPTTIWNSYHDTGGLFERFIRNGYKHSNRVLGHEWYYDEDWDFYGVRQEDPVMHRFVIRANKNIACPQLKLELPIGSEIDCYEAFKYSPDLMRRQFAESGFDEIACWKAPQRHICESQHHFHCGTETNFLASDVFIDQYLLVPSKVDTSSDILALPRV